MTIPQFPDNPKAAQNLVNKVGDDLAWDGTVGSELFN